MTLEPLGIPRTWRQRASQIRVTVVSVAVALFIALFATIYIQMASGKDPALAAKATSSSGVSSPGSSASPSSSSSSGSSSSSSGSGYDDGSSSQGYGSSSQDTGPSAMTTQQS